MNKRIQEAGCVMNRAGFTLVELMVTMVVFVFAIAAASQVFTGLLTQFKQQSKITETNIEGIVGLEILRRDIEHSGYGLPWEIPAAISYDEASSDEADDFNDCSGAAPCNPPRAVLSRNNMTFDSPNNIFNGTDYLVIKAVNVATNETSTRWTHLFRGNTVKEWEPAGENLVNNSRVTVISPASNSRTLARSGSDFFTKYVVNNSGSDSLLNAVFAPPDDTETRVVYGIDRDTDLRMPFNRSDYYIWRGSTSAATDQVPDRCAGRTGVLRKTVIAHADGRRTPMPILDCVADFQVGFRRDVLGNGTITSFNDISGLNPEEIREQLKEVRVFILAHEGQRDPNYTHGTNPIRVGDADIGRDFNLNDPNNDGNTSDQITDWQNYRWKVYTIVVRPKNLR